MQASKVNRATKAQDAKSKKQVNRMIGDAADIIHILEAWASDYTNTLMQGGAEGTTTCQADLGPTYCGPQDSASPRTMVRPRPTCAATPPLEL